MIQYKVGNELYAFSYQQTKSNYKRLVDMNDEDFVKHLPEALHLACFICFLKELPHVELLGDDGLIHELVHLLHIPHEANISIIREKFENVLKLS